jgi:hypothetical protein
MKMAIPEMHRGVAEEEHVHREMVVLVSVVLVLPDKS